MSETVGASTVTTGEPVDAPTTDIPDDRPLIPPALAAAIVAAWAELEQLQKDKTANAGSFSYTYADLAGLLQMARPILAKHGLALIQPITRRGRDVIEIDTWLLHRSGHMLRWVFEVSGAGTPQQLGSQITYARRYSAQAALGVAAVDDDGQAAAKADDAQQATKAKPIPPAPPIRKNTAEEARRKHAMALAGRLGVGDDRDARLALWADIVGRQVESWNDLTPPEQARVIAEMQERLDAVLDAEFLTQAAGEP